MADDFLGGGRNKAAQLDRWASGVIPLGFTVTESIVRRMEPSEFGDYSDGYITKGVATSIYGSSTFDSAFVFDGVNWLWFGDQRTVTIQAQFRASRTSKGTGETYQSFLRLRIEDLNQLAYNAGIRSAIVTGPGLPAAGVKFDRDYPRNRFCLYVSVSVCSGENYDFSVDEDVNGIPENAEYTVYLYDVAPADVSLSNAAVATHTSVASGTPFLPSELNATFFPSYNPEPESHFPADINIGGELIYNWVNSDKFTPNYFYLGWSEGVYYQYFSVETAIDNPTATSVTLDTSASTSGDVHHAAIHIYGHDLSRRGLAYIWEFNRPPVQAQFQAHLNRGSAFDNYGSFLSFYFDYYNFPDFGVEIRSAIVAGPGLPAEGVRFDKNFPRNDFCIINADSGCNGNLFEFTTDVEALSVPANSEYTFYLYDVEPAEVSLGETAVVTYTVIASSTPFLPTELDPSDFPSFNPEPASHLVTDINIGGILTYNWVNVANFIPRDFHVNWNVGTDHFNMNQVLDSPTATSVTLDSATVYQGGTVTNAWINLSGYDSSGRWLSYGWEFSGPPVNAGFEAHRNRGSTYDNYSSFLSLYIDDYRLPDFGVEIQSAIVTGPGLPGGELVMKRNDGWFCIFDAVSGCNSNMFEFADDLAASGIPASSEYTFNFYHVDAADVTLGDAVVASYTVVAAGTPFLPSELDSADFPIFNPEPASYMIDDLDIGGALTFNWVNIPNFMLSDIHVGWNEGSGYFSVNAVINNPTTTSVTLDTAAAYQGGTVTNAWINFSGSDPSGRRLTYVWEFSGPPIDARFEAHRTSGSPSDTYQSFLSLNIDDYRLPDFGVEIQSAIVTGPGLPGGELVMKRNDGWFCLFDAVSGCYGNMIEFTTDAEASSVPANSEYTFNLYDVPAASVSLSDIVVESYKVVAPSTPFLPSELDSADFPSFDPEPVSHLITDIDIGGVLTYHWFNVANFIPTGFQVGWHEDAGYFNVYAGIYSPTTTSVTLDTADAYQSGTVTNASIEIGGNDPSGRRLLYVWPFSNNTNTGTWDEMETGDLLVTVGSICSEIGNSPPIVCDNTNDGKEVYIADGAAFIPFDSSSGVPQGSSISISGLEMTYSGSSACLSYSSMLVTGTRYQCHVPPSP